MIEQTHTFQPGHGQVRVTTQHGHDLTIRHVVAADARLLVELYRQLSPESRRMRFMSTLPDGPAELIYAHAQRMAQIDPAVEAALIVTAGIAEHTQAVGIARLSCEQPASTAAEAAIVMRDDYQDQGLGTFLFDLLLQLAMVRGLERLWMLCFAENSGMQSLVKNSGLPYRSETSRGETTMTIELLNQAPLGQALA